MEKTGNTLDYRFFELFFPGKSDRGLAQMAVSSPHFEGRRGTASLGALRASEGELTLAHLFLPRGAAGGVFCKYGR